jgi:anti-sigma regulatory factor (Ser/Thr protein kinase)
MAADQLSCRLTIPSDLRLLIVARGFVEAVCQAGGLDRSTNNAVVLAVDEAVNNIIRHAHQNNPAAAIQIECQLRPQEIEIHLLDEGEPFDLDAVPHLDPAELRPGGRGVYLMRALMDELSCQPRTPRGNVLRMVKRFPRAPSAVGTA